MHENFNLKGIEMKHNLEPYSLQKEEEIRKFWEKEKIAEKVRQKNAKHKKKFYFMDGPPYATGHIHMGTALNKILKDLAIRYWRMKGFHVYDRPGYDTHGVPIEHQIEKKHEFKSKQDIEKFGVKKFVSECKQFATQFIDTMNSEFNDLGVWMDWSNPYLTLSNEYIQAIWFAFKKAHEKGLLYLGDYSVWTCTRCETAVAFNEIEYQKQTDTSVYVKFPMQGQEKTFLIIWTTTPWTLPGNTGVMVHPDYEYDFVKMSNGEKWVIAKEKTQELMKAIEAGYSIEKTVKGKELEGLKYENPLLKNLKLGKLEKGYRVVLSARYVNVIDGTGLVHCAPGYGKEDREVGVKEGLPVICMVKMNGFFDERGGKYSGKKARIVDEEIISDLEAEKILVFKHPFTHDYPVCWRCKTPLLTLSHPQWFFKITDIQEKMIELNKKVKWSPNSMQARFQNWLESLSDWPVSRARYWGTPLPIWVCSSCKEKKVIGSIQELLKESGLKKIQEMHKPEIDEILIPCKCGKQMHRVPEVLDVWFDAGSSSWGALDFPENEKLFKEFWPAQLNIEGTDQFRGWWNAQMILSTICFDKSPFQNVMVHGMVLGMGKTKMSKSLGNIVQPTEVIQKFNRDYLRYFFTSNSKGEDIEFDWEAFKEINRFFNILWNTYNYVNLYLDIDFNEKIDLKKLEVEDKWILSKLNSLIKECAEGFEEYNYAKIAYSIDKFVVEDLSRTFIKMIRDRVDSVEEKKSKSLQKTLNQVLYSLLCVLAPITPHLSEYMYLHASKQNKKIDSIHLHSFPEIEKKLLNNELEKEMELVKEIIQLTASMREEKKLKLKWVLKELIIQIEPSKIKSFLPSTQELLARMSNVKKVLISSSQPKGELVQKQLEGFTLYLRIDADEELKQEWELRELTRKIQDTRKKLNLNPTQIVQLNISCSDSDFLKKFGKEIEQDTNTKISLKEGIKEKLLEREFFIEIKA